ncbi:MAG: phenylalanine--tRNA ligase subunit alpha [Candidatus Omnitrophica bacterium]|nr:phenylalanine--tRNA ligase subunit alpha [Candidatus Omnitrophota bacterium]
MEKEISKLEEEFQKDLSLVKGGEDLEKLRIKYLGRKSPINKLFTQISHLENREEKALLGKNINSLKEKISSIIEEKLKSVEIKEDRLDLTFPSSQAYLGSLHILSIVNNIICSIFERMGFVVIEGGEIEDEKHNFSSLNIPLQHPSRDVFDTFYLDIPESNDGRLLLRSHTSPSQIRVMEKNKPPLAVISPGRVYRPDKVDASHSFMFHQIEGFAVDKGINFSHLKGVLTYFAKSFFSSDVELRFRPHFFPFTEPSVEVDVSCIICKSKHLEKGSEYKCSVCRGKGWLEILGAGMIHPQVLENCGIDYKKYSGFAFGMGVDRIAMLKYGIEDIRLFYQNDIRFLEQFYI